MEVDAGDEMARGFRLAVVILCAELGLYRAVDFPPELLETLLMTSLIVIAEAHS